MQFCQFEYPSHLYKEELSCHRGNIDEYSKEICHAILKSINENRPNIELYQQQPYLSFAIRAKLIDFLLKMSIRLKILPFVFYKAVKIFDRYCSKRVVLLDQSQLIITTCLWIALKFQGGNNHFVNLTNIGKINDVKTITDLGYGAGGRYLGPTERFRLPKLHELVKLCGAKCKYDQGMFKQMELHILSTLDWSLNDPSIEEVLISSTEFNIEQKSQDLVLYEIFKTKEYLSYVSLYSSELIDISIVDLSEVICSLTNQYFSIRKGDCYYQTINKLDDDEFETAIKVQKNNPKSKRMHHSVIRLHLLNAVRYSSDFMNELFDSNGPQQLHHSVTNNSFQQPNSQLHLHQTQNLRQPPSPRQPARKKNYVNSSGGASNYTTIPPPHQLPINFNSIPPRSSSASINFDANSMPSVLLKYSSNDDSLTPTSTKVPGIPSMNNHNNSQASLHSQTSSRNDRGSIFENEVHSTSGYPGTPISEAYSPMISMHK